MSEQRFITKDSGKRQDFESGARRDTQEGKPRYSLIPPAPLKRLAELYERGVEKYGEHNWSKGMPVSRYLDSAMRHLEQFRAGDTDEDHLAAVAWNVFAMIHFQDTDWNDMYDWTPQMRPQTGAEKYLADRLEDQEYREAFKEAQRTLGPSRPRRDCV